LLRRIDPDYHYPTFGDDGSVEEMAPTLGKFYVKASRGENYGMWGNFKVGYLGNELAQVDRGGLYGASAHYASEPTTSFGERRPVSTDSPAEPGTVPSFEEFRGTGGSLYFLHHQDILTGSERVRIEIRDKDSQIVTGVVELRPGIDYDIDLPAGPAAAFRATVVECRRQPAGAHQRRERRRGVSRGTVRVHAGVRRPERALRRRPGSLLVRRPRAARPDRQLKRGRGCRQQARGRGPDLAEEFRFLVQGAGWPERGSRVQLAAVPRTGDSGSPVPIPRRSPTRQRRLSRRREHRAR